jgi:hypothetical protein
MRVIELRNYLLKDDARERFLRYFEDHFLFELRDEGMYPLGQFEIVGAPNRLAWIRGFDDMRARRRALEGFYGGPVWHARRDEANAMMLEHHDVHLLRPLGSLAALTGGVSPGRALRRARAARAGRARTPRPRTLRGGARAQRLSATPGDPGPDAAGGRFGLSRSRALRGIARALRAGRRERGDARAPDGRPDDALPSADGPSLIRYDDRPRQEPV